MNISFVLAVYNKLELTKECYKQLRLVYPYTPLVISSGGSSDGTKEWLESLNDSNLIYSHSDERLVFSDNFNTAIKMVKTDKLVLIHNDMVIGKYFLENIERSLTEDMLLSYTTIEPPIFRDHIRPGKVLIDLGYSFDDFEHNLFNEYIEKNKDKTTLYNGAVFFMSGYKKMFEDVGFFDGVTFFPAFAEDDDFLIRAKIKGYDLKTTPSAISYHFVSQTSRFSEDYKNQSQQNEINSNRNFLRKWGLPINVFRDMKYWDFPTFNYEKKLMEFFPLSSDNIYVIEPIFDRINLIQTPELYIHEEQKNTNFNLNYKFNKLFVNNDKMDISVYEISPLNNGDINFLHSLRSYISQHKQGEYVNGNLKVIIH